MKSFRTNITSYIPLYAAPLKAPKWYKRPVGASFGFGGKLVSCHARAPAKGTSSILSEVGIYVHIFIYPVIPLLSSILI